MAGTKVRTPNGKRDIFKHLGFPFSFGWLRRARFDIFKGWLRRARFESRLLTTVKARSVMNDVAKLDVVSDGLLHNAHCFSNYDYLLFLSLFSTHAFRSYISHA